LRFKVDNLVKTVEELQLENQRLRGELEAVKTPAEGVWRWQGGGDDLQSLSCPVVVRADRMREITGELEKLRNFVDKARTFGRPTP
jgi:ligand-binding SRPBCC domain-containing protein